MRGKYKSRVSRQGRVDSGTVNPGTIQNGHPNADQNPELVSFLKKILPLLKHDVKDPVFKGNNAKLFESELTNFFKNYTRPLEEYLDIFELIVSNDSRQSSAPKLSIRFTKVFNLFLSKNKDLTELSQAVKLRAFLITSRHKSYDLKKLIYDIYKFADSPEVLKMGFPQIKKNGFHYQSSQWIHIFNAEDQYEMSEYLFPNLLTNDKENIIAKYFKGNEDKVNDRVKFLDSLVADRETTRNASMEFLGYTPLKRAVYIIESNTFNTIKFCIKNYNINQELTLNYNQRMKKLEINFFIQSYWKGEMSEAAFEERVLPLCKDNTSLQDFLINALIDHRLYELAHKFSRIFNKADTKIPDKLPSVPLEEMKYYSVDNLFEMTKFVDSEEQCKSMLEYIDELISANARSESNIPVGFDFEWKSNCQENIPDPPPALFQVAFNEKVYIVDVNKLHSNTDFWIHVNNKLLENKKFIKLGYGLQNDQNKLNYYPNLKFISLKDVGCIDLNKEERKYKDSNNPGTKKFPHESEKPKGNGKTPKGQRGLSGLVYKCFGKFLDKREVYSDWNRRPLRKAQLLYAALDAYCLLQIYEVLDEMHKESGNKFDSATVSLQKQSKIIPESAVYRKQDKPFRKKRRFWYGKKKVEVAVQTSVESNDVSTQTQPNRVPSLAALII